MNPTTPTKTCLKPQKPRRELFGRAHGADDEGDGADEGDHTSFGLRRPLGGFPGFPVSPSGTVGKGCEVPVDGLEIR